MNEEEIRRYRESVATYGVMLQDLGVVLKSVARSLTPRPVKDKMLELMDGIRAQTQQNQGGNPGNPSNQGAQGQQYTPRTTGLFGFAGFLRPKPQSQAPPPQPPTEEQKRQMVEQQKLKVLEDKQQAEKAKRKRLDNMRGLAVDRT